MGNIFICYCHRCLNSGVIGRLLKMLWLRLFDTSMIYAFNRFSGLQSWFSTIYAVDAIIAAIYTSAIFRARALWWRARSPRRFSAFILLLPLPMLPLYHAKLFFMNISALMIADFIFADRRWWYYCYAAWNITLLYYEVYLAFDFVDFWYASP